MKQKMTPINEQILLKGRSKSGMPKLAKNPRLKKKKTVVKKPVARKSEAVRPKKPRKKLPPMTHPADRSRQAKTQPRDQSGKFVPVDQRSFFGKIKAYFNGDMTQYIRDCEEENYQGDWGAFWAGERPKKGKSK